MKEVKKCAHCGEEMKGCPCGWSKTSDGKLVHKKCKPFYEDNLKTLSKKKVSKAQVCAHCGGEFEGKPYFMAMDGKYVHFKCMKPYEQQLYNKN